MKSILILVSVYFDVDKNGINIKEKFLKTENTMEKWQGNMI